MLPPIYVNLDPPFVVNFEAESMVRFLQVTVSVMTRDAHTEEVLKKNDPRIRNDLLLLLGNQHYDTISTREGKEKLAGAVARVGALGGQERRRRVRQGRSPVLHRLRDAITMAAQEVLNQEEVNALLNAVDSGDVNTDPPGGPRRSASLRFPERSGSRRACACRRSTSSTSAWRAACA